MMKAVPEPCMVLDIATKEVDYFFASLNICPVYDSSAVWVNKSPW
jgi:hypothetical protein